METSDLYLSDLNGKPDHKISKALPIHVLSQSTPEKRLSFCNRLLKLASLVSTLR
tara:strand:- start:535 stop:699 length:165 start_codon:yes stop_codon:yes gene_type:complete